MGAADMREVSARLRAVARRLNGNERTPATVRLDDVDARLDRPTTEVTVIGEVKRGKSTLMNALVGSSVSTTRLTPETAVPVRCEEGGVGSTALLADGSTVSFATADEAAQTASQRLRREGGQAAEVVAVTHGVLTGWLPPGVTLVDTPGLSDPSLVDDYAEAALAAAERSAAVVLVLVSPPGISSSEVSLLRHLSAETADKLFIVCNFYSDQWRDEAARAEVDRHLRSVLDAAGGDLLDDADRHVFHINAKLAMRSSLQGDEFGVEDSGLLELQAAIAGHLTDGALRRRDSLVLHRLVEAKESIRADIAERLALASDPSRRRASDDDLERRLGEADAALDDVIATLWNVLDQMQERTLETLARPFDSAIARLDGLRSISSLDDVDAQLRMRLDTALKQTTNDYHRTLNDLDRMIRSRYLTRVDGRSEVRADSPEPVHGSFADAGVSPLVALTAPGQHAGSAGAGAAMTAAAGSVIGGTLAGGAGVALLAAGPVGWLIGAGIGAALGAGLGGAGGYLVSRGSLSPQQRTALRQQLANDRAALQESSADRIRADGQRIATHTSAMHSDLRASFQQRSERIAAQLAEDAQAVTALMTELAAELEAIELDGGIS